MIAENRFFLEWMMPRPIRWIFLPLLLGLLALPAGVWAGIGKDLQATMATAGERTYPVIVSFAAEDELRAVQALGAGDRSERGRMIKSLRQRALTSQQQARTLLQREAVSARELWLINALALEASAEQIARLAGLPEVVEVRLDRKLRLPVRPAAELVSGVRPAAEHWNLEAVGAPALWARGLTGAGVVVASVDSGVDPAHADLATGYRGGSNSWFDPNNEHATPFDADGHGTGTLGVAVGRSSGSGVAPGASWIAVKIFNDAGFAFNSRIHEGFQWLLDPDGNPATDDAPDIVINSWGFEDEPGICDQPAREFQPDIQALKAAGIAVVFAAGNTGPAPGSSVSPGNYPESLAVGAVNSALQVPAFSARGPSSCDGRIYPDLVAPGVAIQAPDLTAGGLFPHAQQNVSGTSFAAPHLAGVMALLLSDPVAPPPLGNLESVLRLSATDLGPSGADNSYGVGLVNALAAHNMLNAVPQLAMFDTTAPASDRAVSFGQIPPGAVADTTVELVNVGGGQLDILGVDISTLPPSLSLVSNGCSFLLAGERCALVFRFAPLELGSVTATVGVSSTDPAQGVQTLQLSGVGNHLPTPAVLATPLNGASLPTTTVVFSWNPGVDSDGDPVSETLVLARNPAFSAAASFPVAQLSGPAAGVLLAGVGGLFGLGLLRRHPLLAIALALSLVLTLVACGGGGGEGGLPSVGTASLRVADLQPGTLYYWKVQSSDSRGGVSESEVRQFTSGF